MLSYDVAGTGPPLVLLHAGVADRHMWDDVVAPLSSAFTVITPDLRGFGQSPIGTGLYSHVDDVASVLGELGVDRAAVVGASFGGLVALQLAHAAPHLVDALVLAAPPLPGWTWSAAMTGFWEEEDAALERGDLDAAVEVNVTMWAGADPAVRARVREMQRRAFELQLDSPAEARDDPVDPSAVGAPTLVVVGSADLPDFAGIADHLVATMPDATKRVVDGAGHLVAMERPAEFAALVADSRTA